MYEEQENCTLTCNGEEVAMKSVHVHGKLDGLLLRMKVRQTYTNESDDTLETVYTFPMAWGATLLNLAVELNGKRLNGTVIEKKQAVKQYEQAIDNGDSPIMVERSGRGLYTANLGNLLPGETAVIEIEYAQLLNFEADRIRLNIPTTIAPRYGDQHQQGGLQPHQTAAANGIVEYGFFMTLDIQGTAAKGMVSSPTHAIKTTKSFDGINVQLGKQTYLDRDFVLLMAMTDVFNMNANGKARNNPEVTDSADVLLITDGDVWNIENILASARISGHRVYTIGVGSAPAESLLREVAKDTGGSCEFVTPREDMRSAVDRMLTRMRSAQEVRFAIKWNAIEDQHKDHEWASTLPPQLIDGETVHLFARLPAKTEKPPVLICKILVKEVEQEVSSAKPLSITWDTEGIVARLVAATQVGELTEGKADTKLAKSLAMKYQLVTQHTNLFLVHERAEENKADGLPKLQQVAQMQAAGFGGYGSVSRATPSLSVMRMSCNSESFEISDSLSSPSLGGDYGRLNTPSVWRTNRTQAASKVDGMSSAGMDDIEIPAFLRKQADSTDLQAQNSTTAPDAVGYAGSSNPSLISQLSSKIKDFISSSTPHQQKVLNDEVWLDKSSPSDASREDIAMTLNKAALHAPSFRIALQQTLKLKLPFNYASVIIELTKTSKDSATSWALLFEWLFGNIEESSLLDRHAQRLLRSQLKLASEETQVHANEIFKSLLENEIPSN